MSTIWNKGTEATDIVENFTVGNDKYLDIKLAKWDVIGSMAHIKMLKSIGLLKEEEEKVLQEGLNAVLVEIEAGKFSMDEDIEDIHSQIESLLTRKYGEVGKKIHSGRSRNDQVLVDIKLYLKSEIKCFRENIIILFNKLQELSEKYKEILLPGYTHAQIAMPSSFGLWFGAYAEILADDMFMLKGAYNVINQNPLGSAAGYGSSFPLDREMTTRELGFATLNYNSIAAQMSRGKAERALSCAMGQIAYTLNKFAADCCMYMCNNFSFIKFPDELTTGSSIMPHKKNPDVWEIIRGNCNRIQSVQNELALMTTNLPHGYHRDYQLLKEVIFPAIEKLHECLNMTVYMLNHIIVNVEILKEEKYKYLFTVEEVNRRVMDGIPFRDAYIQVGKEVNDGNFNYCSLDNNKRAKKMSVKILKHTHKGSIGNLCTAEIKAKMQTAAEF
jgi:argininosuccinate lyase